MMICVGVVRFGIMVDLVVGVVLVVFLVVFVFVVIVVSYVKLVSMWCDCWWVVVFGCNRLVSYVFIGVFFVEVVLFMRVGLVVGIVGVVVCFCGW